MRRCCSTHAKLIGAVLAIGQTRVGTRCQKRHHRSKLQRSFTRFVEWYGLVHVRAQSDEGKLASNDRSWSPRRSDGLSKLQRATKRSDDRSRPIGR